MTSEEKPYNTSGRLWLSMLVLVLCLSVIPLTSARANDKPVPCGQKDGIGSVFYNFDKLYILYTDFPRRDDQEKANFPSILKYENFNKLLIATVKKNFAACLKTASGQDKEVISVPPSAPLGKDSPIQNPSKLTIVVSVDYSVYPPKSAGKEPYGTFSFFFYRPEVAYKWARLPMRNNSGVYTFFTDRGEAALEKTLEGDFNALRPHLSGLPSYITIEDMCQRPAVKGNKKLCPQ